MVLFAMSSNSWQRMNIEEARAYDKRKECGPLSSQIAVKRKLLLETIIGNIPHDLTTPVLDLGGGTGAFAIPLALMGHKVILADISDGFLARAGEKIRALGLEDRITLRKVDMVDLSAFPDNRFQLVLAIGDPLSYCGDAEMALWEIRRVTKPGGILIADVENRYRSVWDRRAKSWSDTISALRRGIASWPDASRDNAHVRLFTPDEIECVIHDAGWQIIDLFPSDLLSSLAGEDRIRSLLSEMDISDRETALTEWIDLERTLRQDRDILGCGSEIQFVARNAK
jgi:ubiquinone/menaquinone biosynthesis C-methylase UbiE